MLVLLILFILFFPLLAHYLTRFKIFDVLGAVVLCYMGGIAFANFPFAIEGSSAAANQIAEIVIPLAIPLLVFSTDFKSWLKLAPATALSFSAAVLAVLIVAASAPFIEILQIPEAEKVAAMMVGVYTGGTPNLAAIGISLQVSDEAYVLVNAADVIWGGLYFFFLISIGPALLARLFSSFSSGRNVGAEDDFQIDRQIIKPIVLGTLLSTACLVVSFGLAQGAVALAAFSGMPASQAKTLFVPIIMLGISAGGLLLSLLPRIRALKGTYQAGEYLVLVFCVSIGSLVKIETLFSQGGNYILFCGYVMVLSVLLHFMIAKILRIDRDTVIITSVAAIYGPPFVGVIADKLKNKDVLISGLTAGLVGYAIGTPAGLLLYALFASL